MGGGKGRGGDFYSEYYCTITHLVVPAPSLTTNPSSIIKINTVVVAVAVAVAGNRDINRKEMVGFPDGRREGEGGGLPQ